MAIDTSTPQGQLALLHAQFRNFQKWHGYLQTYANFKEDPAYKRHRIDDTITQLSFIFKHILDNKIIPLLPNDIQPDLIVLNYEMDQLQNEIDSLDAAGLRALSSNKPSISSIAKTIDKIKTKIGMQPNSSSPKNSAKPAVQAHQNPAPADVTYPKTLKHLNAGLQSAKGKKFGDFLKDKLNSFGSENDSRNLILLLLLINWLKSNDDACADVPEIFQNSIAELKVVLGKLKNAPKNTLDLIIETGNTTEEYKETVELMKKIVTNTVFTPTSTALISENAYKIICTGGNADVKKDDKKKDKEVEEDMDIRGLPSRKSNPNPSNSSPQSAATDKKSGEISDKEKESKKEKDGKADKSPGSSATSSASFSGTPIVKPAQGPATAAAASSSGTPTVSSLIAQRNFRNAERLAMDETKGMVQDFFLDLVAKAYIGENDFSGAERVINAMTTSSRDTAAVAFVKQKLQHVHLMTNRYLDDIGNHILVMVNPLESQELLKLLLDNIRGYLATGGQIQLFANNAPAKSAEAAQTPIGLLIAQDKCDAALVEVMKLVLSPARDAALFQVFEGFIARQQFANVERNIDALSDLAIRDSTLVALSKAKALQLLNYMKTELTTIDRTMSSISHEFDRKAIIDYYLAESAPKFVQIFLAWYSKIQQSL